MSRIKSNMKKNCCWPTCYLFVFAACIAQVTGENPVDFKVRCSRSGLTVHVNFDTPFDGVVYSKGHYDDPKCIYANSINNHRKAFSFKIPLGQCGTSSYSSSPMANALLSSRKSLLDLDDELILENTIIIQQDPLFQMEGDLARTLRCVWRNNVQKTVTAKIPHIYEPALMTLQFDHRALDSIVDVETAPGPLASPTKGFISSVPGHSSLVIYLKDSTKVFDANTLNCTLINERGESVGLTDEDGCITTQHLITPFYKSRAGRNDENADVILYTYFKDLKLSRNSAFSISCDVEICFSRCGDRCRSLARKN